MGLISVNIYLITGFLRLLISRKLYKICMTLLLTSTRKLYIGLRLAYQRLTWNGLILTLIINETVTDGANIVIVIK